MRRPFFNIFCIMILAVVVGGCAAVLQDLIEQPPLQVYTFTIDGRDYSALLPGQVLPPPESAQMKILCFPQTGSLCVMHVRYIADQEFPQLSFWFTAERGVLALVSHVRADAGVVVHTPYVYVVGIPVEVDSDEINRRLREWGITLE